MEESKKLKAFGMVIKKYRLYNELTQQQLADLLGVSRNTVPTVQNPAAGTFASVLPHPSPIPAANGHPSPGGLPRWLRKGRQKTLLLQGRFFPHPAISPAGDIVHQAFS